MKHKKVDIDQIFTVRLETATSLSLSHGGNLTFIDLFDSKF